MLHEFIRDSIDGLSQVHRGRLAVHGVESSVLSDPVLELLPRPRLLPLVNQLVSDVSRNQLHDKIAQLFFSEWNSFAHAIEALIRIPLLQRRSHILGVCSGSRVVDLRVHLILSPLSTGEYGLMNPTPDFKAIRLAAIGVNGQRGSSQIDSEESPEEVPDHHGIFIHPAFQCL